MRRHALLRVPGAPTNARRSRLGRLAETLHLHFISAYGVEPLLHRLQALRKHRQYVPTAWRFGQPGTLQAAPPIACTYNLSHITLSRAARSSRSLHLLAPHLAIV